MGHRPGPGPQVEARLGSLRTGDTGLRLRDTANFT